MGAEALTLCREAEKWGLISLEKRQLQRDLTAAAQHLPEATEKTKPSFLQFLGGEMEDDEHKLEQERFQPFPHEEKAVTQAAQEHCAVSIHGSFQDLCKYSPEQPGLSSLHALPGAEVGPETSQGPSQPEVV